MSEWAPKRFWTQAEVSAVDGGYAVTLDGRGVKTPAKTPLVVPTPGLAEAICAEWQAQEDQVDPASMPFTRMANSALDKVTPQQRDVADMLADYGDCDLLCYRADHPAELVARQEAEWGPVLAWAADALGARLQTRQGIMHQPQDPDMIAILRAKVHDLPPFALAAFHDLVSISGSLVLGFAAAQQLRSAEEIWRLSRLDEAWQEEQWGEDEEASAIAQRKCGEFVFAEQFYRLATEEA